MSSAVYSLALFEQKWPDTPRPWRIIEKLTTSEGYRDRVCEGTYATEAEARERLSTLMKA